MHFTEIKWKLGAAAAAASFNQNLYVADARQSTQRTTHFLVN